MRAVPAFSLSLLSLAVILVAPVRSSAADAPPLRIATGEWRPWVGRALPRGGPITRLVEEAMARRGRKVEWIWLPWARALEETRGGRHDATVLWSPAPDRLRDFLYSAPLVRLHWLFHYRRGDAFDWSTMADLRGRRVGVTLGYWYGEEFAAAERAGTFVVDEAPTDLDNLRKLAEGRVSLVPLEETVAEADLRGLSTEARARVVAHPKPFRVVTHHLIFSKQDDDPAVRRDFDEGLAELHAEGWFDALLREAGLDPTRYRPSP